MSVFDKLSKTVDEIKSFDYAELALNTSVEMLDLTVVSVYTTDNEESSSNGAMTITCKDVNGKTVSIRTIVLRDQDGKI